MSALVKAVVLAAGRGTRMREDHAGARLDPDQARMAELGLKPLIPFHGHPFLAYVLTAVADAGFREICLVVRPGDDPVRRHFEKIETRRVKIDFAVQEEPRGSAHALLAAEDFAGSDSFLLINADNFYPAEALAPLHDLEGNGLMGFTPDALSRRGNIRPERIAKFALVTTDVGNRMASILEKPSPAQLRTLEGRAFVSMTCWRFGPGIFPASREIPLSVRGEYELPDAVLHASRMPGGEFTVIPSDEAVLDLSGREDVHSVDTRLRDRSVRL